ncbi:MAG: S-layer family protein [Cyanobacteriota bacterium]|nr:S-layer family protein [Cyanobacteriota bacterium]
MHHTSIESSPPKPRIRRWYLLPLALCLVSLPARGQVVPDATLPENSRVLQEGNNFTIQGGTERGSNLFHSFEGFSLPTGTEARFDNAPMVENIFSRVTGGSISEIDGTIRANGAANLFLLNPNGILFGPNARLEIGGSFFATTAESLLFADGTEFGTVNPEASPLLTVNVPIGLQFGAAPGAIEVEGPGHNLTTQGEMTGFAIDRGPREDLGLRVDPGRTLTLVGGDLTLTGGNLTAEEGAIELGSVGGNSRVGLNLTDTDLALAYEGVGDFQDIELSDRASVDASGPASVDDSDNGGGEIRVRGRNVRLLGDSVILSLTESLNPGRSLSVNATELVELIATGNRLIPTSLLTETRGTGSAGNLSIAANQLILQNGAQASSSTLSPGRGGNLSVNVSETVELIGTTMEGRGSSILATTDGFARGGNINISADRLVLEEEARVGTDAFPLGNDGKGAGHLNIDVRQAIVRDGGQISTATFGTGSGGDLRIRASESVEVTGTSPRAISLISTQVFAPPSPIPGQPSPPLTTGQGGDLTIETGRLVVGGGAGISTATTSVGTGGTLKLDASESIEIRGAGTVFQLDPSNNPIPLVVFSSLNALTESLGNAGDVIVNTDRLTILDGGQISTATRGPGDGGNLNVTANESINLSGVFTDSDRSSPSFLTARTIGLGDAGNLTITTDRLSVRDGAEVNVSTALSPASPPDVTREDLGAAGSLFVAANESIDVSGFGSLLTARTSGSGDAGNVTINTDRLSVRDGAQIKVSAEPPEIVPPDVTREDLGAAGSLFVNAEDIRLDTGGSLNATTTSGSEGNITLNTRDLRLRRSSGITTTATGNAIGGNITIDTDTLTALENSDISADAENNVGGRVEITADGVFLEGISGTNVNRQASLEASDITATSALGAEFDGIVEFNTPDIDPSAGLIEEPTIPPPPIRASTCSGDFEDAFVITGRGGLPPSPGQPLTSSRTWEDTSLTEVPETPGNNQSNTPNNPGAIVSPESETRASKENEPRELIEAQGWYRNEAGQVVLTAHSSRVTPSAPGFLPFSCHPFEPSGES